MNANTCTLCNLPIRPDQPASHTAPIDIRDGRIVTLPGRSYHTAELAGTRGGQAATRPLRPPSSPRRLGRGGAARGHDDHRVPPIDKRTQSRN